MKKTLIWTLAVIITLGSAYYQRKTGPTHPKKVKFQLEETLVEFKLLRSSDTGEDCEIKIFRPNMLQPRHLAIDRRRGISRNRTPFVAKLRSSAQ